MELPRSSGLCDSAGATAGMASLAACSTGADTLVRPYTVRHWVEWRAVGKGAKAGWKAGRRLESLPHIGHDMEGTGKTNYREHGEGKPQRARRTRRKQTTENTEKANHRGHGGHGEKQTTENTEMANHRGHGGHGEKQTTENTEMEKRGRTRWAASMRRRPEVERAVVGAGWSIELPYISGLRCSAGATAGMASLAACSTLQRRPEVERAVVGATAPVLAADGVSSTRTSRDCVALPA